MVGTRALFDTNILIDYLSGVVAAQEEMGRYVSRGISVITWMEVMAGAPSAHETRTRAFLSTFQAVPITPEVAERAVTLRRDRRIKLPDAIILASALMGDWLLVTRNTRDFPEEAGVVRVPYRL